MCPICIATAVWMSACASSTAKLTAFLLKKRRVQTQVKADTKSSSTMGRAQFLGKDIFPAATKNRP